MLNLQGGTEAGGVGKCATYRKTWDGVDAESQGNTVMQERRGQGSSSEKQNTVRDAREGPKDKGKEGPVGGTMKMQKELQCSGDLRVLVVVAVIVLLVREERWRKKRVTISRRGEIIFQQGVSLVCVRRLRLVGPLGAFLAPTCSCRGH